MRRVMSIIFLGLFTAGLAVATGCEEPEVEDLTPTRVTTDENATEEGETPYEEEPGVVE